MHNPIALLLTCEHAGNQVPPEWRALFQGHEDALASHRGYDIGALELARRMAKSLRAPLIHTRCTRLLIEANRRPSHPNLFSFITKPLPREAKNAIAAAYYEPHRKRVQETAATMMRQSKGLLHVGVHTFTPQLDGIERNADVGLLYDPAQTREKQFAAEWKAQLLAINPALTVRRNYPYLGVADGLIPELRRAFKNSRYIGIELEVNQKYPQDSPPAWKAIQETIAQSLRHSLANLSA